MVDRNADHQLALNISRATHYGNFHARSPFLYFVLACLVFFIFFSNELLMGLAEALHGRQIGENSHSPDRQLKGKWMD